MTTEQKVQKVDQLRTEGVTVTEAARRANVSTPTYYKFKNDRKAVSTAPKKVATRRKKKSSEPVTLQLNQSDDKVTILIGDALTIMRILTVVN